MLRVFLLTLVGLCILSEPAIAQKPQSFSRCVACHLSDGAGVPGAFPSLQVDARKLAQTKAGRKYLALVVIRGVSGLIVVDGRTYRGSMPAQGGLDDAAVASVLNYVVGVLAKSGPKPKTFTADEIKAFRSEGAGLGPAQVAKLRPRTDPAQ